MRYKVQGFGITLYLLSCTRYLDKEFAHDAERVQYPIEEEKTL
jgi:hypothetical protein